MRKLLIPILLFISSSYAQVSIKDSSIFSPYFKASYGIQIPGGDIKERFGINFNIGGGVGLKLKNNFLAEFHYNFLFGEEVKETSMINELLSSDGFIYNNEGVPSLWSMQERGYILKLEIGKIFPVFSPNPNSGILIKLGGGFIQHKIKFRVDMDDIPQFNERNVVGYDRLTFGLLTNQFLGYQYFGNNRLINFYAGFEAWQGFTRGRRDYQVDLAVPFTQSNLDLFLGFKVGWIIPFYRRMPQEFYTN